MPSPSPPRPLFNEAPLWSVFDQQEAAIREAVDVNPAPQLRKGEAGTMVSDLFDRFRIEPIAYTEGAISAAAEEAQVDVSGSWDRDIMDRSRPYYVPGVCVSYFVPFTGGRELFRFQPSPHTFHLRRADVGEAELTFQFSRPDTDVGAAKRSFEEEFQHTKEWTSWANQDVERFNSPIHPKIAQLVNERQARLPDPPTQKQPRSWRRDSIGR